MALAALSICPLALSSSQDIPTTGTGTIIVTMDGFRNYKGFAVAALFQSPEGYPEKTEKALMKRRTVIQGKSVTMTFENVPYGQYALSILHDENDSRKLERGWFGIPKEGYGIKKNTRAHKSTPRFHEQAFMLRDETLHLDYRIHYFGR